MPHVHVFYGDFKASVSITGELLAGSLPSKILKIVTGWLLFHEDEVADAWRKAANGEHFDKIKPM